MNAGISTACFYPMLTEEALNTIAKNGIPYAEIFVDTFSEIKSEYMLEVKKNADFYGTKIVSLHPFTCAFEPFMFFTNYERRFNDALEMHRHYFNAMNILEAKIFVFHGDRFASKCEDKLYFERFAKLRDLGKEFGITVAQENVARCKSRSLDFLCDMVDYLDHDVSIVFDNKQAIRSGIDYHDFINRLYKYIIHVHISDNSKECDCLPIGSGTLNICEFLSFLNKCSSKINVIIELYNELLKNNSQILQSYEKLNQFIM